MAKKKDEKRTCLTCEKQFSVKRSWQRFCSTDCRNEHHIEYRRQQDKIIRELKAKVKELGG